MASEVAREQIAEVPLFRGLTEAELEQLRPHTTLVEFLEGDQVLREGYENDRLLCILSGYLRVWRAGTPNDLTLAEVGPGSVLGELTFLDPGEATATATALEPGLAVAFSAEDLSEVERQLPRVATALYRRVALTLRERLVETTALIMAHKGIQEALDEVDELRISLGKLL